MTQLTAVNPNPLQQTDLDRLQEALRSAPVLILTHHNPDPDALAAGDGLAFLLERAWGLSSHRVFSGLVTRAENVAVLRHLTPGWEMITSLDQKAGYESLALVDTQPGAANNILPPNTLPDAVLDHHQPIGSPLTDVPYADLRPEVGSTATLVFQHLEVAGLELPSRLATALFYGIKTDTNGLSHESSKHDEVAYIKLLDHIDRAALVQVENAQRPPAYFRELAHGIRLARVHGTAVVASLGDMHRPDFTAELADLLIRLEGASAAICVGRYQNVLYLSVRTVPMGEHASQLLRRSIEGLGKAGGHRVTAGGQVWLEGRAARVVEMELVTRFLAAMGEGNTPGVTLTASRPRHH